MPVSLKLNYTQAVHLKLYFDKIINPELPEDVAESLIKDLMFQAYKKLRNKLEGQKKDGYSIALSDIEGKAFYLYFQNRLLGPNWVYEQNVIDRLMMVLDKQYA